MKMDWGTGRSLLAAAAALLSPALASESLPLIKDLPLDVVSAVPGETRLPTEAEPVAQVFSLPSVPQKTGVLCLRFEAFLETSRPAGWNAYLGIELNGRKLEGLTESGENRLLKRGPSCATASGKAVPWWGRHGAYPALLTFFGPPDQLDERVTDQREEGCWYLLDISDAAHFFEIGADDRIESEQANRLTLVNTLRRGDLGEGKPCPPLVVRNLQAGYLPEEVVAGLRATALERFAPLAAGPQLKGRGFTLTLSPSGGMEVRVGKDVYFVSSLFSFPGTQMGFNTLRPDAAAGQPCWKPEVRQADATTLEVRARGEGFVLTRTLRLMENRVAVSDRLENLSQEPLGMAVRNDVTCAAWPHAGGCRMGGVTRAAMYGGLAANPSLFLTQGSSALGVLAEDDVLRLQLEIVRSGNTFRYGTSRFGLEARGTYTLEWSLYPSASKDYFDFVNQVRRDWKTNFTIEGPFAFDGVFRPERQTRIYTFGPWLDFHHDGSQTWEGYKAAVAPLVAALKASQPGAVLLPKIETTQFTFRKDRIPGGEILPGSDRKTGRYGWVLDKRQSGVLEKALGLWSDSVIRTGDGRILVDTFYPEFQPAKTNLFNLLLYLKKGNQRHRHCLSQVDFLMDQLGFSGIYIDQFSMEGAFNRTDRNSYHEWDGHTVELDAQGRISRLVSDCNLVGAEARADILRHILAKGGKAVVNGQPTVRETQSLPVFRFQEMDNDNVNPLTFMEGKPPLCYWQARGHLASPIILGLRPERYGQAGKDRWAECITKGVITALRNGVLYYYYTSVIPDSGVGAGAYGPCNHMFPFTPVELHEGWLVGAERTITCLSGAYRRPGPAEPACFLFDRKGRDKPAAFSKRRDGGCWVVDVRLDDWNEIAVVQ